MEPYKTRNKNNSSNEPHLISVIILFLVKMKEFSVLRSFPIAKYKNPLLFTMLKILYY